MVEPLFFAADLELASLGDTFTMSGPEAKHAAVVKRMSAGEAIQLTNGRGLRVRGTVASSAQEFVVVKVSGAEVEPLPDLHLTLVQALAKGDRDELAIQAATELGVSSVIPWQAERSVSRWEGSKIAKSVERWQQIVQEAAKQALRVYVPTVLQPVSSKQLVEQVKSFDQALVLDPTAEIGLFDAELPKRGQVALIVGPEGGISQAELSAFENAGAIRVHLGNNILRTSTAGMAAISALQAKVGNYSTK
ncbi:MAG: 16S rRNA (uracil(1498)-N(3))-methyltransferase [Micrococcales bacterium]